jgi:hypothetical protein
MLCMRSYVLVVMLGLTSLVTVTAAATTGATSPVVAAAVEAPAPAADVVVTDVELAARFTEFVGVGALPEGVAFRLQPAGATPASGAASVFMLAGRRELGFAADGTASVYDRSVVWELSPGEEKLSSMRWANLIASEWAGVPSTMSAVWSSGRNEGVSGGVAFLLVELQSRTGGTFLPDGVRVAATGQLWPDGHINGVTSVAAKFSAAVAADVDVVFAAGYPVRSLWEVTPAVQVNPTSFAPGTPLAVQRQWDRFAAAGTQGAQSKDTSAGRAELPALVVVRHVGDVAAFLCGAGSATACRLLNDVARLDDVRLS